MTEKEKLQELGRRERVTESRVGELTDRAKKRERGWQLGAAVGAGEGAVGRGVLGSGEAGEYGGPGGRSRPPSGPQLQPA